MIKLPLFFLDMTSQFYHMLSGNLILWSIAICSIIGLTIFIERFIFLHKSEIDSNQFVIDMRKAIEGGNLAEAAKICEDTGGSISQIIKAGIAKYGRGKGDIENAMELAGIVEIARLEKNAKILSIIAHIAPLIGLLGTVLGFIQAFGEMRQSGLMDISTTRIGQAMEFALVTTAAGLVVAIPSIIAYNYIVSRIASFVLEIQIVSSEIVDLLVQRQQHDAF